VRRLDCPYVFHRNGRRSGELRKPWAKACAELGLAGRIVHDLRRSGVRHLIRGGTPPHTLMASSRPRAARMLKRYDIIDVDDLRRACRAGERLPGRAGDGTSAEGRRAEREHRQNTGRQGPQLSWDRAKMAKRAWSRGESNSLRSGGGWVDATQGN